MKIEWKKYLVRVLDFLEHLGLVGFVLYTIATLGVVTWSAAQVLPQEATGTIFILIPVPYIIAEVSGQAFQVYFVILWFSGVASLWYLLSEHINTVNLTKIRTWSNSEFSGVYAIFTLTLAFSFLYQYLLMFLGTGIQAPAAPDQLWQRMYLLTRAAVWEEILVRMGLIGVPMAAIGIYKGKGSLKDIFGGFGFDRQYWFLFVLLSVSVFTLGHLPGWNLWKLPQVIVPGILFSYIFIKIGLHAAIGVHLIWNFMSITEVVLGSELFTGIINFFFIIWMIVGVGLWLKVTSSILDGYRRYKDDGTP